MSQLPFKHPVRIYWEDTDAGGVVYHASYVRFLERARSEWLRQAGITQEALLADLDIVFAVRAMRLDFRKPGRLDDLLDVTIERVELRPASMVFVQRLLRPADETLLVDAEVRCACLRGSDFRPRPMPPELGGLLAGPSAAPNPSPE